MRSGKRRFRSEATLGGRQAGTIAATSCELVFHVPTSLNESYPRSLRMNTHGIANPDRSETSPRPVSTNPFAR